MAVGAGQIGPLVGAIVLGMLADRLGRKRMLFICALIFGLFTWLTSYITSVEQLAACRLLAGIGLGGAIPNALSFGCEYAPSRLRASLTTMMWAGMPIGSIIGGLSAAYLLPVFGWQSLFFVGGVAPMLIGVLVALFLPESLAFLVRQGTDTARIRKIVARIAPALAADETVQIYSSEQKLAGAPVKHLFTEGRTVGTLLLWVLFFFSFYLLWIMLSWAPTLLRQSGATIRQYTSCLRVYQPRRRHCDHHYRTDDGPIQSFPHTEIRICPRFCKRRGLRPVRGQPVYRGSACMRDNRNIRHGRQLRHYGARHRFVSA